jgi:hypothetical protein
MIKFLAFLLFSAILLVFPTCKGMPPQHDPVFEDFPPPHAASAALRPEHPPERIEDIHYIMGNGRVDQERLSFFLIQYNPFIELNYVLTLAGYYIEEAQAEGVNHDIAFSQMCLETGFLSYGGLVTFDMNNFCGLGSTGLPDPDGLPERGLSFPDPQTGVRAHIQHLKAYGTSEPLNQELVDPRYKYVRLGSSPTIEGLAGTWATDKQYAGKINNILRRLYDFAL